MEGRDLELPDLPVDRGREALGALAAMKIMFKSALLT